MRKPRIVVAVQECDHWLWHSFGCRTFPEGAYVAQVFPDSGSYIAVFPGTGGMRMSTLQEGH
jgi:hypothetical protein